MSTERQLRNYQLTYKPHPKPAVQHRWSPYRVGIFLGAMMAAAGLIAFAVLNAMKGMP